VDGLTQTYLTGNGSKVFRVDLCDGEYEVTVISPAVAASSTSVRVGDVQLDVGGQAPALARATVAVHDGAMMLKVGDSGRWALAGLIVRSVLPQIAHLPPVAVSDDEDAVITATATAPTGVTGMLVCYRTGSDRREVPLARDGVSFSATVPAVELSGDTLSYSLIAEGRSGVTETRSFHVPIVRGFQKPRAVTSHGPATWSRAADLIFELTLENGESASEIRLHYREADQNAAFRTAVLDGGRSGLYEFVIAADLLDDAYELIYYFEIVDALGGGSFYPDPLREARYFVSRPR
jgi:hypothetical protein